MKFKLVFCFLLILPIVSWGQTAPKKVTRAEGMSAAVQRVQPEYPSIARQLKIGGIVQLEALVSENGTVEDVKVVSGNAALTKAADEALRKWKFAPFVADGKVTKALVPIEFEFKH